jgi:hypothetical protein
LLVPTTTFATEVNLLGAGEWDLVRSHTDDAVAGGNSFVRPVCDNCWAYLYTVDSYGGDFSVIIDAYDNWSGTYEVMLYEDDPDNPDDPLWSVKVKDGQRAIWRNIGSYVDGEKAEFYIKVKAINSTTDRPIGIKYYD